MYSISKFSNSTTGDRKNIATITATNDTQKKELMGMNIETVVAL